MKQLLFKGWNRGKVLGTRWWNYYLPYDSTVDGTGKATLTGTAAGGVIFDSGVVNNAVQIAEATTNLVTNPSFETGTTGWTKGGINTIAQSSEQAKFGSYSLKCTYQDNNNLAYYQSLTLTAVAHSASIWLYIPSDYDGTNINLKFASWTGASGTLQTAADMSKRDQWQRVLVPNVTPDAGDLSGDVLIFSSGTAPTAGKYVYIDGLQVEAKAYVTPYCDGSLGDGHTWDGADHGSTSQRAAASVSYTNPLSSGAGSINFSWIPACNQAGPDMVLFDEGSLKAYFNAADDKIYFTDGTNTISTAALTFSANVAQRLSFRWGGGLTITRNGSVAASGATYTAPSLGASLYIGSDTAGANQCNGLIDELYIK